MADLSVQHYVQHKHRKEQPNVYLTIFHDMQNCYAHEQRPCGVDAHFSQGRRYGACDRTSRMSSSFMYTALFGNRKFFC